jgi:hypothetical protein
MVIVTNLVGGYDERQIRNALQRFSLEDRVEIKEGKLILFDIPQDAPFDSCDIRDALKDCAQVSVGIMRMQY